MVALEKFGETVGRGDPDNAHKLLCAPAGSRLVASLFAALNPKFGACIPKCEALALSKVVLKGALAEGMYRLSKAAEATVAVARWNPLFNRLERAHDGFTSSAGALVGGGSRKWGSC